MPKLIVPFATKVLYLPSKEVITEADIDFSEVSYFDKKRERVINPNAPYISENLVAQPFDNQRLTLDAGLYLHFILPNFLRSEIPLPDANGALEDQFAPLPNRWLVIKNQTDKYIVESDYLHPEYEEIKNGLTIPVPWEKMNSKSLNVPFRYIGRQYALNQPPQSSGDYWYTLMDKPLTIEAYDTLTFNTFFPNCRNALSFYDTKPKQGDQYEIWAWYDFGQNTQVEVDKIFKAFEKYQKVENLQKALEEEWEMQFENTLSATTSSDILLYCKIKIDDPNQLTPNKAEVKNDYKIAIGNSGTEVVSAFLASELETPTLENILEAIQFDSLQGTSADIGVKFVEERHHKSFTPHEGGIKYVLDYLIKPAMNGTTETKRAFEKLKGIDEISSTLMKLHQELHHLNQLQRNYDKNIRIIQSQRHQLFADWYKYMLSAHPPYQQDDDYPRADDVLRFVYGKVLADIVQLMNKTGMLHIPVGTSEPQLLTNQLKNSVAGKIVGVFSTIKTQIATVNQAFRNALIEKLKALDIAQKELETALVQLQSDPKNKELVAAKTEKQKAFDELSVFQYLKDKKIVYRIISEPSQRYYEPNEPVLLLSKGAKSTSELTKFKSNTYSFQDSDATETILNKKLPLQTTGWYSDATQILKYQFDWVKLEWQIEYRPIDDPSLSGNGYDSKFVFDNFDIRPDTPDFNPINGHSTKLSEKARLYTGSTILSMGAQNTMQYKLQDFVNHLGENQTQQKTQLQKVLDYLDKNELLTQSIGGFNQALLMRKQTMQLEVADPIAFDDYQPLIKEIRTWIGDQRKSAPEPKHYFNPIRAGAMVVKQLRFIDSFGIAVDVFKNDSSAKPIVKSNTLDLPDGLKIPTQYVLQKPQMAYLPPRFAQPARINLSWVGANDAIDYDNEAYTPNPICGWIMPNFLEKNIAIFDQSGDYIGSFGVVGNNMILIPKPGDTTFYLSSIKNEHLLNFVKYFYDENDTSGSVDLFEQFLAGLSDSLEYIEPETYAQHNELALLTGKPLALIRAKVNMELQDDYAINQDWHIFKKDLYNSSSTAQRETYHFEEVKIPLRIGDYDQLNDGVIGFWYRSRVADSDQLEFEEPNNINPYSINISDTFYMPLEGKEEVMTRQAIVGKSGLKNGRESFIIEQSLVDKPQIVSMLFDPRAKLNVSAGILPVKTIDIPSAFYKSALEKMRIHFLVSPIITPYTNLEMSLPNGSGMEWSWLSIEPSGIITEIPAKPTLSQPKFQRVYQKESAKFQKNLWSILLSEKWIVPNEGESGKATVNDLTKVKPLQSPFLFFEKDIKSILKDLETTSNTINEVVFEIAYRKKVLDKQPTIWDTLIKANWLEPLSNNPMRAYVNFDINTRKKLPEYLDKNQIDDLVNTYFEGIGPASTDVQFEQMAIKEGWLVLGQ